MASAVNSLRLCLRAARPISISHTRIARPQHLCLRRPLSTTPSRLAADEPDEKDDKLGLYPQYTVEEQQAAQDAWDALPEEEQQRIMKLERELASESAVITRPRPKIGDRFWNEHETDTDLITDEVGEDDFEEDDIMSMAHGKLEEHREHREYARIAVWEMPLLSKLAKKFEPPKADEVLRFRFTTYMGEIHPADRKVVVEFCPKDLKNLSEAQQVKLMKLAGPRYNPEKEIVRMSCERFEHPAQNKRYLGDMIAKLIEAAKDPTDMFEDVPLDTRHHTVKVKARFPREWRMSDERRKELQAKREQAFLLDETKKAEGALVDGKKNIREALAAAATAALLEPVMVPRGRSARTPARGR